MLSKVTQHWLRAGDIPGFHRKLCCAALRHTPPSKPRTVHDLRCFCCWALLGLRARSLGVMSWSAMPPFPPTVAGGSPASGRSPRRGMEMARTAGPDCDAVCSKLDIATADTAEEDDGRRQWMERSADSGAFVEWVCPKMLYLYSWLVSL